MPAIYVVHSDPDTEFVNKHLIPMLPSLGYDRWASKSAPPRGTAAEIDWRAAVDQCPAALVVVSSTAVDSAETERLACKNRVVIPVHIEGNSVSSVGSLLAPLPVLRAHPSQLNDLPKAVTVWRTLSDLLPVDAALGKLRSAPASFQRIPWHDEFFSAVLADAITCRDHGLADRLVATFVAHLPDRKCPPPPAAANADLAALRSQRYFAVMRKYCEGVLEFGNCGYKVRRQYGQALIELREYDRATLVLEAIVRDAPHSHPESAEARGLLGRVFKQLYVNEPNAPGSHGRLQRAIREYATVCREDPTKVWHGVNAASCMLRGVRDAVPTCNAAEAHNIADEVLKELEKRETKKTLDVWDYASKVEALLALGKDTEAATALDAYLAHGDMQAFEVSSTHRQFEEVLQLGADPARKPLLEKLWQSVRRHRGSVREATGAVESPSSQTIYMLITVTDSAWEPEAGLDLEIRSRLERSITASGTSATVDKLLRDPRVVSVAPSLQSHLVECRRSLPYIKVAASYPSASGAYGETGANALVAIIDDGIDVLHETFRDANGKTRLVGVWDQRDKTGPPPATATFGKLHTPSDIQGYIDSKTVPAPLGRHVDGHGTHVASIAAGRATSKFFGGVAPEAPIFVVISSSHQPTGYSDSHVAALKCIDATANALKVPVVVNVSQGMNAGAHDGQSALGAAFDTFSDSGRRPGRIVVKSAGNERDRRGHAVVTVPPKSAELLKWQCNPDTQVPTEHLEFWWHSANEYRFRLHDPLGNVSPWVDRAHPEDEDFFVGAGAYKMTLVKRHVDNAHSLLQLEYGGGTGALAGVWALDIEAVAIGKPGPIHGWIERGGRARSEFLGNHASEEMTISVPGTARSVITVGAVDAADPIRVGDFSSYGPTRDNREKPDVVAPGVGVIAAKGGTDDDVRPEDGTSMAAPHVAGAIALLLSREAKANRTWPSANQVAEHLRQKTANYTGQWDRGQGYGVIDVTSFLTGY